MAWEVDADGYKYQTGDREAYQYRIDNSNTGEQREQAIVDYTQRFGAASLNNQQAPARPDYDANGLPIYYKGVFGMPDKQAAFDPNRWTAAGRKSADKLRPEWIQAVIQQDKSQALTRYTARQQQYADMFKQMFPTQAPQASPAVTQAPAVAPIQEMYSPTRYGVPGR